MQARKVRILTEVPRDPSSGRRSWVLAAVVGTSLLGVVAATAVVPGQPEASFATQPVIEHLLPAPAAQSDVPHGLPFVYDEQIKPGDTIHSIFARLGIRDQEALDFLNADTEAQSALKQLRAGRSVLAAVSSDGRIVSLNLPIANGGSRFSIVRVDEAIHAQGENAAVTDTRVEMRSGMIRQTLFGATDAAGVPDAVATKLAEIFGTEIDFTEDLRRGDEFSVVYEATYDRGLPFGTQRILAAEFINQGKKHAVVLYRTSDGAETYYTPDGRGLNQAYLRYPLEFSRISSNFGGRLHPIHKKWRAHNGVDFAAPRGTAVKAASDGTVDYVGNQNGYGKIVVLRHRDRYSTAYAHLDGFARGLRKGAMVRQGDLIGYVGSSGWATGPHLHYEIRVNNVAHDPMKIALPTVQPLDRDALVAFKKQTSPFLQRLALLNRATLARVD
ncbi:M23 family metallopeptidase [Aromatoleum sp.]|uniref:M23 family metallopeptidase n=1 Tax=Aromatoleum sp. TaxID=2307007 RepID=UPI002FC7B9B8